MNEISEQLDYPKTIKDRPPRSKVSLDSFHAALELAYKARHLAHEIGLNLVGPAIEQDKSAQERSDATTFFDQLDQVADLIREAIVDINSILASIYREIK